MASNRIERLPFTVYDIMGYFILGAYFVFHLVHTFYPDLGNKITEGSYLSYAGYVTVILITAYMTGHVTALIASETLERLWVAFIGYPSKFSRINPRDREKLKKHVCSCRRTYWGGSCFERAVKCFKLLIFAPHLAVVLCTVNTSFIKMVIKPLDAEIWQAINTNFQNIFGRDADLENQDSAGGGEDHNFKIIDNYIFSTNQGVANRQHNYVTIYGFCRNMCFVTYAVSLMHLLAYFIDAGSVQARAIPLSLQIIFDLLMSLFLFVAFIKFFRRYTHDALLAFAVITDTDKSKKDAG